MPLERAVGEARVPEEVIVLVLSTVWMRELVVLFVPVMPRYSLKPDGELVETAIEEEPMVIVPSAVGDRSRFTVGATEIERTKAGRVILALIIVSPEVALELELVAREKEISGSSSSRGAKPARHPRRRREVRLVLHIRIRLILMIILT